MSGGAFKFDWSCMYWDEYTRTLTRIRVHNYVGFTFIHSTVVGVAGVAVMLMRTGGSKIVDGSHCCMGRRGYPRWPH